MSNIENQTQLRNSGIIPIVLELFETHLEEPAIVKRTIDAICGLAKDEINQKILLESCVCDLLIDAFCFHTENKEIRKSFIMASVALSESHEGQDKISSTMRRLLTPEEIAIIVDDCKKLKIARSC